MRVNITHMTLFDSKEFIASMYLYFKPLEKKYGGERKCNVPIIDVVSSCWSLVHIARLWKIKNTSQTHVNMGIN